MDTRSNQGMIGKRPLRLPLSSAREIPSPIRFVEMICTIICLLATVLLINNLPMTQNLSAMVVTTQTDQMVIVLDSYLCLSLSCYAIVVTMLLKIWFLTVERQRSFDFLFDNFCQTMPTTRIIITKNQTLIFKRQQQNNNSKTWGKYFRLLNKFTTTQTHLLHKLLMRVLYLITAGWTGFGKPCVLNIEYGDLVWKLIIVFNRHLEQV